MVFFAAALPGMQKYRSFRSLRVADALAWSDLLDDMPEAQVHGLYGLSWVMVHWLFRTSTLSGSRSSRDCSPGGSIRTRPGRSSQGLKAPDLDVAINQYVSHGNYQEFLAPFTNPRPPLEESPLTEAERPRRARTAGDGSGTLDPPTAPGSRERRRRSWPRPW